MEVVVFQNKKPAQLRSQNSSSFCVAEYRMIHNTVLILEPGWGLLQFGVL